jgi:hypothetical protein
LLKVGHCTPPNLLYNTTPESRAGIRRDDLDYVHRKQDLDVVVPRIEDRLMGLEEVVFQ